MRQHIRHFETLVSYIPLFLLIVWSAQVIPPMITSNPYGSYIITFPSIYTGTWKLGRHIRGFTLLSAAATYIITFHTSSHLRPILRSILASLIPFTGLTHYEFWWHTALHFTTGYGEPRYWRAFAACLLLSLYYVNRYYIKILDLSPNRLLMLTGLYIIFMLSYIGLIKSGFYPQLLLWYNGLAPDPHNIWWALGKIIGVIMWTTIIKKEREEKESPLTSSGPTPREPINL